MGQSVDIDKLNLQFSASLGNVKRTFSTLEQSLNGVSRAMSNVNTDGITRMTSALSQLGRVENGANSMRTLANAMTRLSNVSVGGIVKTTVAMNSLGRAVKGVSTGSTENTAGVLRGLASSLNAIGRVDIGRINPTLTQLGTGIRALSNTIQSLNPGQIVALMTVFKTFTESLRTLGSVNIDRVVNALPALAREMENLMQSLARAPTVSQNVIQMTNALAQLSQNGARVGTAASGLNRALGNNSGTKQTISAHEQLVAVEQKLKKALHDVAQAMKTVAKAGWTMVKPIASVASHMVPFANSIRRAKEHTNDFAATVGKLIAKYWLLVRAIQGLSKLMGLASSLTEVDNVVAHAFGTATDKVNEFSRNAIEAFGMSELSAKTYASRFQAMMTAMEIPDSAALSANQFIDTKISGILDENAEAYRNLGDSVSDVAINLTKLTADYASFFDVAQDDVAQKMQSILTGQTRPLREYGLDLTEATLKEWALKNGLDADISSMTQAEKAMLRYRYVMSQSSIIMGDFARTADTFHNSVVRLKENSKALGITIGESLIQVFKPVIQWANAAIVALNTFAKTVSNALGKILGWSKEWVEGGQVNSGYADEIEDIGGAAGGAAGKVKELNKQLQGFDELNNLTTNDDNGGGGGGGGTSGVGAGGASAKSGQWVDKISDYESELDTPFKLGAYFNEALQSAFDGIDWEGIQTKVDAGFRGLAEFINGINNDPTMYEKAGTTVAEAFNTITTAIDAFATELDWVHLGDGLASFVKGIVNNVDIEKASNAGANLFNGIAKAVKTYANKTPWVDAGKKLGEFTNKILNKINIKEAGQAVHDLLTGIMDLIGTYISTVDWKAATDKIGELIAGLNIPDIAGKLGTLAKNIIGGLRDAIAAVDWVEVGKKIGEMLAALDLAGLASQLAGLALDIVGALAQAIGGMVTNGGASGKLAAAIMALLGAVKLSKLVLNIPGFGLSAGATAAAGSLGTSIASAISGAITVALTAFFGYELGKYLEEKLGVVNTALETYFGKPETTSETTEKKQYGKNENSKVSNYTDRKGDEVHSWDELLEEVRWNNGGSGASDEQMAKMHDFQQKWKEDYQTALDNGLSDADALAWAEAQNAETYKELTGKTVDVRSVQGYGFKSSEAQNSQSAYKGDTQSKETKEKEEKKTEQKKTYGGAPTDVQAILNQQTEEKKQLEESTKGYNGGSKAGMPTNANGGQSYYAQPLQTAQTAQSTQSTYKGSKAGMPTNVNGGQSYYAQPLQTQQTQQYTYKGSKAGMPTNIGKTGNTSAKMEGGASGPGYGQISNTLKIGKIEIPGAKEANNQVTTLNSNLAKLNKTGTKNTSSFSTSANKSFNSTTTAESKLGKETKTLTTNAPSYFKTMSTKVSTSTNSAKNSIVNNFSAASKSVGTYSGSSSQGILGKVSSAFGKISSKVSDGTKDVEPTVSQRFKAAATAIGTNTGSGTNGMLGLLKQNFGSMDTETKTKFGAMLTSVRTNTGGGSTGMLGVLRSNLGLMDTDTTNRFGAMKTTVENTKADAKFGVTAPKPEEVDKNMFSPLKKIWKNLTAKATIDAPTENKTELKAAYDRRSAIWKPLKALAEIMAPTENKRQLESAYSGRKGIWQDYTANFNVSTEGTGEKLQGDWNYLTGNVWKDYNASFGISVSASGESLSVAKSALYKMSEAIDNLNIAALAGVGSRMRIAADRLTAKGGVFDSPTWRIFGEDGAEAVVPLEKNIGWAKNVADLITARMPLTAAAPPSPASNYAGTVYNVGSNAGVTNAVDSNAVALQNDLLQQEVDLLKQIAAKDLTISSSSVFNAVRTENQNYYNRTGNSAFFN